MNRIQLIFLTVVGITCILQVKSEEQTSIEEWREIYLDDLVPEVKLPIDGKQYRNYSFSLHNDIRNSSKGYKISLVLWKAKMTTNDSLDITAVNENGKNYKENWSVYWFDYSEDGQEVDDAVEIKIQLNGLWLNSSATLVATIYHEVTRYGDCPSGFYCMRGSNCGRPNPKRNLDFFEVEPIDLSLLFKDNEHNDKSSREDNNEDNKVYRCISSDLQCNSRPNCGTQCTADEDSTFCYNHYEEMYPYHYGWYDVQYLLTILLAGLFFILSPICIVIFLFYHRRMRAARNIQVERQRAVRVRDEPYTVSPRNDNPPTYEDFYEIKTPPPSFESVARNTPNPDTLASTSGSSSQSLNDNPLPPTSV